MNSFRFCVAEDIFIWHSFSKAIFAWYIILRGQLFSFISLMMLFQCLLTFKLSLESQLYAWYILFWRRCLLFSGAFSTFSLCFVFNTFTLMFQDLFFLHVYVAKALSRFLNLWLNVFTCPFTLFFFFLDTRYAFIRPFCCVYIVSFFFFFYFSFAFSSWWSLVILYWHFFCFTNHNFYSNSGLTVY